MFKKKSILSLVISLSLVLPFAGCSSGNSTSRTSENTTTSNDSKNEDKKSTASSEPAKGSFKGKKVLWVDSYKDDYAWSKDLTPAIKNVLEPAGVELKIYRMDTKNNPQEDFKKKSGEEAKKIFDEFKPDVVIQNDDNSMKYFVVPFLKNSSTPVVSIGVNWSGKAYSLPFNNTTGLYEVQPVKQALDQIRGFAKGSKVGYISSDNESAKIDADYTKKTYSIDFAAEYYCKNFSDFKEKYSKLQTEVDIVLFNNNAGIKDWNDAAAKEFILNNTKVPSATCFEWVTPYTLVGVTTVADEHGKYAAETALKILGGTKVSEIPFSDNKKGNFYLNQKLASKLSITFKPETLKGAKIIN